jgi:hypothetical protein
VEKEKQVQIDIARESGKPEEVIEKMIVGRMKKFLAEVTLLNQQFVVNPDLTVAAAAKEAGVEITGFVRLEVGEGIVEEGRLRGRGRQGRQGLNCGADRPNEERHRTGKRRCRSLPRPAREKGT